MGSRWRQSVFAAAVIVLTTLLVGAGGVVTGSPAATPIAADSLSIPSDPPPERWNATYGPRAGNFNDVTASNGTVLAVGSLVSADGNELDGWVVNATINGTEQWNRTYGGSGDDVINDVYPTPDGGAVLVGTSVSQGPGREDGWMLRIDRRGDVEWRIATGGPGDDGFTGVERTRDGYLAVGTRTDGENTDGWLVRVSTDGDLLWTRTYDTGISDSLSAIDRRPTGGYVLAGETATLTSSRSDGWVLLVTSDGRRQHQYLFGGQSRDGFRAAEASADGSIVLTGTTRSFGGTGERGWALSITEDRETRWEQTYATAAITGVTAAADGGYLLASATRPAQGLSDATVVGVWDDGSTVWTKTTGGTSYDSFAGIARSSDGGYVLAGTTGSYGDSQQTGWLSKLGGTSTAGPVGPPVSSPTPTTAGETTTPGGASPGDTTDTVAPTVPEAGDGDGASDEDGRSLLFTIGAAAVVFVFVVGFLFLLWDLADDPLQTLDKRTPLVDLTVVFNRFNVRDKSTTGPGHARRGRGDPTDTGDPAGMGGGPGDPFGTGGSGAGASSADPADPFGGAAGPTDATDGPGETEDPFGGAASPGGTGAGADDPFGGEDGATDPFDEGDGGTDPFGGAAGTGGGAADPFDESTDPYDESVEAGDEAGDPLGGMADDEPIDVEYSEVSGEESVGEVAGGAEQADSTASVDDPVDEAGTGVMDETTGGTGAGADSMSLVPADEADGAASLPATESPTPGTFSLRNVGPTELVCRFRCHTTDEVVFDYWVDLAPGATRLAYATPTDPPFEILINVEDELIDSRVFVNNVDGGTNVTVTVSEDDIDIRRTDEVDEDDGDLSVEEEDTAVPDDTGESDTADDIGAATGPTDSADSMDSVSDDDLQTPPDESPAETPETDPNDEPFDDAGELDADDAFGDPTGLDDDAFAAPPAPDDADDAFASDEAETPPESFEPDEDEDEETETADPDSVFDADEGDDDDDLPAGDEDSFVGEAEFDDPLAGDDDPDDPFADDPFDAEAGESVFDDVDDAGLEDVDDASESEDEAVSTTDDDGEFFGTDTDETSTDTLDTGTDDGLSWTEDIDVETADDWDDGESLNDDIDDDGGFFGGNDDVGDSDWTDELDDGDESDDDPAGDLLPPSDDESESGGEESATGEDDAESDDD